MSRTRNTSLWLSLAAALACFAQAAPAAAERPLELGFTGYTDTLFSDPDPAVHDLWLDRSADAGAEMVVLAGFWSQIASASPPADPTDPSDPSYSWDTLDAGVRNASAHGLKVMIIVTEAPDWAEGPNRPPAVGQFPEFPVGTWKPDPGQLAKFATAVATRYSGHYVDPASPGAGPLPAVRLWEVWAEPNLQTKLSPQYEGGTQFSSGHYRRMLNAFYAAAKDVDPKNKIVTGGLAPYGDKPGGDRTHPLTFLRKLFCLRDREKLKPVKCPQKASFDVLGHNPINLSGGPRRSAVDPDDASSADLGEVARTLRAAERGRTVRPGGRRPLWATEFWWKTKPPDGDFAVSPAKHGRWIEEALYLFWKAGASAAINLKIRDSDDQASGVAGTGLYFLDGTPKPALTAFRFPFVTERRSKSEVFAWGKAPVGGKLRIERKQAGGWRAVGGQRVGAGEVFTERLEIAGAAKLRASVDGQTSLVWSQRR